MGLLLVAFGVIVVIYFIYSCFNTKAAVRENPISQAAPAIPNPNATTNYAPVKSSSNSKLSSNSLDLINRLDTSENVTITISVPKAAYKGDTKGWEDLALVITALSAFSTVLLVISASNSEEQEALRSAFNSYLHGCLPEHRMLFYSTTIGKVAIVRQLSPAIHFEYEAQPCDQISPHARVVFVDGLQSRTQLKKQPWRSIDRVGSVL